MRLRRKAVRAITPDQLADLHIRVWNEAWQTAIAALRDVPGEVSANEAAEVLAELHGEAVVSLRAEFDQIVARLNEEG